jgi:hypothetical protein
MNAQVSNTDNKVRKTTIKGELEISRVYAASYQKEGTLTAEIKQTVTTKSYYPSKSVSSNFQDNYCQRAFDYRRHSHLVYP